MDRKLLKKIICLLKDSLMRFYKQIVRNFSCFKNASNGDSDTAPSVFQDLGSFLLVIRQGLIYEQKHLKLTIQLKLKLSVNVTTQVLLNLQAMLVPIPFILRIPCMEYMFYRG